MTRCPILAAIALICTTGSSFAQTKEWLALPLGPAQDLVLEAAGDRTARIPVRPADAAGSAPAALHVRVFDVSSKDGHGKTLAGQFDVKLTQATEKMDAAMEVNVSKNASEVVPGPYALSLRIAQDFADPKNVQSLSVTLIVPQPQLSVDPVVVGREIGFLGLLPDTVNRGVLSLTEKGGKTPVHGLDVAVLRDVPATGQPDSGNLSIVLGSAVVEAGKAASAPVSVVGDFPPGKATGKIEVRSRDLAAPVTTTFEVRTRRSLLWIAVMVALGAALGYFVRNRLTARRALLQAAATASSAVGLVKQELAGTSDATYKKELDALLEPMREALISKNAEAINKAAAKLQDDLVAARGRFEQRFQPVVQSAIALHTLIDRDWPVPQYVQNVLGRLRDQVKALSNALAARDVDGAKDVISKKVEPELLAAANAVEEAGGNLVRLADEVVSNSPPLVDDDYRHLSEAKSALSKMFSWPAPDRVSATLDQLLAALSAWTSEGSVVRKLFTDLPGLAKAAMSQADARLGLDPQLDALATKTVDTIAAAKLNEQATAESPDLSAIADRLLKLRQEWVRYFMAKAPGASQPDLEGELSRGAWMAALDRVKKAMPAAPVLMGVAPTAKAGAATATAAAPSGADLPRADAVPPPKITAMGFQPASLLLGTVDERSALLDAAERASMLQSFLLGLLFVVGVYCLYADNWTGTEREMFTLFMFAFGLDLTADNVVSAFKKLKLPEIGA